MERLVAKGLKKGWTVAQTQSPNVLQAPSQSQQVADTPDQQEAWFYEWVKSNYGTPETRLTIEQTRELLNKAQQYGLEELARKTFANGSERSFRKNIYLNVKREDYEQQTQQLTTAGSTKTLLLLFFAP